MKSPIQYFRRSPANSRSKTTGLRKHHPAIAVYGPYILLIIFLLAAPTFGQIRIVTDLNQGEHGGYYEYPPRPLSHHVSTGTRSFFVAEHFGREMLWTSDGTTDGTVFLKDFTDIIELEVSGGILFFTAMTDKHGAELWKSDGTVDGTMMLKDIYPGAGSSTPSWLTDVNGTLYFSANNRSEGRELWRSDGTAPGTQLVKDVYPGSASSNVTKMVAFNGGILFVANDGNTGYELWKSDGTDTGTALVRDIFPMAISSAPQHITVLHGFAYFSARSPVYDRQLYKSDGTSAGTSLVKVIRPGGYNAKINNMVAADDVVFFEAFDGIHGAELWKSDGTAEGTVLVKDITPGPASAKPENGEHLEHLVTISGKLFFIATPQNRRGLWSSDGTPEGTHPADPGGQVYFSHVNPGFTRINDHAYFIGNREHQNWVSLFRSDGNTTTLVKAEFAPPAREAMVENGTVAADPEFVMMNGDYYFFAGGQLWKTDGTEAGTVMIKHLRYEAGSGPGGFADLNGTVLFAMPEVSGHGGPTGFWKSNGTAETTTKLAEILIQERIEIYNDMAFFPGWGSEGLCPFRSDGTPEGTIALSTEIDWPTLFTGSNGLVFFQGDGELYKTDGTPEGTSLIKDILPGSERSYPYGLRDVNNTLFFTAQTEEYGRELWKSDGTASGTVLVKDITPGPEGGKISGSNASYMGHLIFLADDGVNGLAVWKSNGTPEGTVMVPNQSLGVKPLGVVEMATSNQFVFFTAFTDQGKYALYGSTLTTVTALALFEADDFWEINIIGAQDGKVYVMMQNGPDVELWRSNGTPTGTYRIYRFRSATHQPTRAAFRNGVFYFGTAGTVWRSDGTTAGTYSLPFLGRATQLTTSGDLIYFAGETFEDGSELFVIEPESTFATYESLAVIREHVSGFPNPFRSTMTLHVAGPEKDRYAVDVVNSNGQAVSSEQLDYNVDHTLGSSWNSGVYFIRIRESNRVTMRKVIKMDN